MLSDDERKKRNAERAREYRKTHPDNKELHRLRSKRYYDRHFRNNPRQEPLPNGKPFFKKPSRKIRVYKFNNNKKTPLNLIALKRGILTYYGGGKCACVKCGIDDIDCLSIDHINNDAHHRQHDDRVGGKRLYQKLIQHNYPSGYQTLCMNCQFKKSLEHIRNNGHKKQQDIEEILPLFKFANNESITQQAPPIIEEIDIYHVLPQITSF